MSHPLLPPAIEKIATRISPSRFENAREHGWSEPDLTPYVTWSGMVELQFRTVTGLTWQEVLGDWHQADTFDSVKDEWTSGHAESMANAVLAGIEELGNQFERDWAEPFSRIAPGWYKDEAHGKYVAALIDFFERINELD